MLPTDPWQSLPGFLAGQPSSYPSYITPPMAGHFRQNLLSKSLSLSLSYFSLLLRRLNVTASRPASHNVLYTYIFPSFQGIYIHIYMLSVLEILIFNGALCFRVRFPKREKNCIHIKRFFFFACLWVCT